MIHLPKCVVCGKLFQTYPSRMKRGGGLYCSRICHSKAMERPHLRVSCAECGKNFKSKNGTKHCSPKCSALASRGPDRVVTKAGYILVRDESHPNADRCGMVREHIKVMTSVIGRPLADGECVHHKNRNPSDNRPENLQLMTFAEHTRLHRAEDKKRKLS